MSKEADLYEFLTDATAVTNLVGTRIYPGHLPENVTYPAITFEFYEDIPSRNLSDDRTTGKVFLDLEIFGFDPHDLSGIQEAIHDTIAPNRQDWGSTRIITCSQDGSTDTSYKPRDGNQWITVRTLTYDLTYNTAS